MTQPLAENLTDWALQTMEHRLIFHATAVALGEAGVLILGAAGQGKSSLALRMIAQGATLICDDTVWVDLSGSQPFLERPDTATDLIEVRGVGLLRGGSIRGRAALDIVIDLDRAEPDRLPPRRMVTVGTTQRPLILGAGHPTLAEAVLHMLRHGRDTP